MEHVKMLILRVMKLYVDIAEITIFVVGDLTEYIIYPTSRRYKIVKVFSKCIGTSISFGWKITWKIERRFARSCC